MATHSEIAERLEVAHDPEEARSVTVAAARSHVRSRRWTRNAYLGIVAVASILAFAPILGSPIVADDIANSQLPQYLAKDHVTRWHFIAMWNSTWMHYEGRFFPGALTYGTFLFTTFTTRIAYKTYAFILLIGLLVAVGFLVAKIFPGRTAPAISIAAMASCWEFRYPVFNDGIASFSDLAPWTVFLTVLALIFSTRTKGRLRVAALIASLILWTAAIVTYEYALLLTPAMVAALFLFDQSRRSRAISTVLIVLPSVVDAAIVGWLRLHLTSSPGPEYTLIFGWATVTTSIKQFTAALPLGQYWIPDASYPHASVGGLLGPVIVLALMAAYCLTQLWRLSPTVSGRRLALLGGIGLWIWIAPSILVGSTQRWQLQTPWGQGYLAIAFESLGFAFVILAVTFWLRNIVLRRSSYRYVAWAAALGIFGSLAIALTLTAAFNLSVVT